MAYSVYSMFFLKCKMNKIKINRILDNAIATYGIEFQVNIAMEELSELCQIINKYFNRSISTKEEVATEIADVELCMSQLKRMLGETIIDELANATDINNINKSPSQDMAICGKAIHAINSYFMDGEYYLNDLITLIVEVQLICKRYRIIIGHELVETHKQLKIVRLERKIINAMKNSKEL